MKIRILLSFLLIPITVIGQNRKDWISIQLSPRINFTENTDIDFALVKGPVKPGFAFGASIGYGRIISRSGLYTEISIGYTSYRLSVEERNLYMHLDRNSLSYSFYYLTATAKIGFVHQASKSVRLAPSIGIRYIFYLPEEKIDRSYHYVDTAQYHSYDITFARYNITKDGEAISTFLLSPALKIEYSLNDRFTFTLTPFCDIGFSELRTNIYYSEQIYTHNADIYNHNVTTNKGDAVGVEIGVQYNLKH